MYQSEREVWKIKSKYENKNLKPETINHKLARFFIL
jgi:hypothetical protein